MVNILLVIFSQRALARLDKPNGSDVRRDRTKISPEMPRDSGASSDRAPVKSVLFPYHDVTLNHFPF